LSVVARKTKGERTAERLLDAAEPLFARNGYEGTTLREIARRAGIREPGVYNHFESKQTLYEAVLDRALTPMTEAMAARMGADEGVRAYTRLPAVMTDLLLEHPEMAALFQQALQGDPRSIGNRLIQRWLDRLFAQALETTHSLGLEDLEREALAIQIIAMFNLCTGYFLSQRAFESMVDGGDLAAPENIARQKRLLRKIARATLID